jgi:lipid A ethanolaminephosphotransferase
MFLDVGKEGYKDGMALRREGLLDVLQRAGVSVLWRDNNSGCKGICDRVPNEKLNNQKRWIM